MQEVLSQASYYSVNDQRLHFGLGAATEAELEIRWPSGDVRRIGKVQVDRLLTIRESK